MKTVTVTDVLTELTVGKFLKLPRGHVIYGPEVQTDNLYLVLQGKVTVRYIMGDGYEIVIDLCRADDFFGESVLASRPDQERATVLTSEAQLMFWKVRDIEKAVMAKPQLGFALAQTLARRITTHAARIASLGNDKVPARLARALLDLARDGEPGVDDMKGYTFIAGPYTHEFLSQVVGTTREITTLNLTRMRRDKIIRYSRQGIGVREKDLAKVLGQ